MYRSDASVVQATEKFPENALALRVSCPDRQLYTGRKYSLHRAVSLGPQHGSFQNRLKLRLVLERLQSRIAINRGELRLDRLRPHLFVLLTP